MVWVSKGTYRTVRRQATSEDTPASIKTSRPKPEPVPALPGPLCSAMVVIGWEAAMCGVRQQQLLLFPLRPCSYRIFPEYEY